MDVLVNVEHRFRCTPDGAVWTQTQFPYAFWRRYLDVFSSVQVVARAEPVNSVGDDWLRVDGDNVTVHGLPHYLGLQQYLKKFRVVQRSVEQAVERPQAVILRVHSPIAKWLEKHLHRSRHPYGVEVVADPWDLFSPGAIRHPLRPLLRRHFRATLRRQCRRACASAYVTQFALQERYPPYPKRFTTFYSSIELSSKAFSTSPRQFRPGDPVRIIIVGALSQMYKGVDLLIEACAICRQAGTDIRLTIVGDGQHRDTLTQQARETGIGEQVEFLGNVPAGDAVRAQLDKANLFVLPSRQEGLPRSMIEAMARGLPCLGTSVGGIPEILPAEDLVPPNHVTMLADKIREVAADPARMNRMAKRNLARAADFEDAPLRARRNQLYSAVRDATEQWLSKRHVRAAKPAEKQLDAHLSHNESL